jgi:hypothetical protein
MVYLQEEFENGFGSHTPMYSGQTKCVRYYMNHERAMDLAKECLLEVRGQASSGYSKKGRKLSPFMQILA